MAKQPKEQKDFHGLMNGLITKYGFDKVDQYQFLKIKVKDTQIKPSQLIFFLVILLLLVFLIFDGAGFICSIGCYLIPAALCLKQMSKCQNKKNQQKDESLQNEVSKNISYTDEQLMKMQSAVMDYPSIAVKYIVYYVFYSFCQMLTPLYCVLFSEFSWTLIRLTICFFMLYPETNFSQKLWKDHIQSNIFKEAE